jgi:Na+-driven multidrug efflux pump
LIDITKIDKESRSILKLGFPLALSEVSEAVFEAVTVALISRHLGVNALSAYVITNLLIGLSDTFINGVGDALNTVCSHAIGCENYKLAGQYAQIAMVIYFACAVPLFGTWWFVIDKCLHLFGVNVYVVSIGSKYTKAVIFHYLVEGIYGTFRSLLDVSGYATQATIIDICFHSTELLFVWVFLATKDWMDLFWVGVIQASVSIVCMGLFFMFVLFKGWLQPYYGGLFMTFGLSNTTAVKYVLLTALPLAFGSLLEYGEVG